MTRRNFALKNVWFSSPCGRGLLLTREESRPLLGPGLSGCFVRSCQECGECEAAHPHCSFKSSPSLALQFRLSARSMADLEWDTGAALPWRKVSVCVCVRELCVELCVRSFVPPAHTDTGAARRPFFPKTRLFVSLKCMCIVRIAAPLFLYRSICVLCWPRLAESVLFVLRSAPHWRRLREARAVLCFVHAHACTGVFMQAPGAVVAPATPLHTVPTRP
jgi:hypothetical protein